MYSCGGPYRDIYNHVLLCMAMYPFPISIPIFGYFKPLYDKYTKYLPFFRCKTALMKLFQRFYCDHLVRKCFILPLNEIQKARDLISWFITNICL